MHIAQSPEHTESKKNQTNQLYVMMAWLSLILFTIFKSIVDRQAMPVLDHRISCIESQYLRGLFAFLCALYECECECVLFKCKSLHHWSVEKNTIAFHGWKLIVVWSNTAMHFYLQIASCREIIRFACTVLATKTETKMKQNRLYAV